MKKGFGLAAVIIGALVVFIAASGIFAVYTINKNNHSSPKLPFPNNEKLPENKDSDGFNNLTSPTPGPEETTKAAALTNSSLTTTVYTQPEGIYFLKLPGGWVVNSTFATKTYSTTKFTGSPGNISITFGTGKDPAGGCSEASAITLADRVVNGCFLLQKDGSRILTRTYTKTTGNIPITIEAYINPPLATNQPTVMSVVKTIDVK